MFVDFRSSIASPPGVPRHAPPPDVPRHARPELEQPTQKRARGSVEPCLRPLLLVIVRGHAKRLGGRTSINSFGSWSDVQDVLTSIKARLLDNVALTSAYRVHIMFHIVYAGANQAQRMELEELICTCIPDIFTIRIVPNDFGPCQTDSLLVTVQWMRGWLSAFTNPSGFLFLRVDCLLKEHFLPQAWLAKGFEANKAVFPFKVWEDGGPSDQIFFIPSCHLDRFEWALQFFSFARFIAYDATVKLCARHSYTV